MKRSRVAVLFLILLVAIAECIARFALGLGTPPLSIAHRQIEYMYAPDQDLSRFHNVFRTNHYAMRSRNPDAASDRYKILVLGDSVINGGSLTNQSDLATSILERDLGNGVFVGNISAGSWGPPNLLAYIETYGTFEADTVTVVISGGDICDVPSFTPLDPRTHPMESSVLALGELITVYVPRYAERLISTKNSRRDRTEEQKEDDCLASAPGGLRVMRRLIALFNDAGAQTTVVRHPTIEEFEDGSFNARLITSLQAGLDGTPADYVDAKRFFFKHDAVEELYRDRIHVNEAGQLLYAKIFLEIVSRNMMNASIER